MKINSFLKLVVLVFTFGMACSIQGFGQKKVEFGLMIGPEFNTGFLTRKITTESKNHPKLGFIVEGHSQINFNSHLSLDIGLGYARKRFKTSNLYIDPNEVSAILNKANTIQLPILMKYYFGTSETRFFVGLGINSILSLSHTSKRTITYSNGQEESENYKVNADIFDISPQMSIGLTKKMAQQHLLNAELYLNVYPLILTSRFFWMASSGLRLGVWL